MHREKWRARQAAFALRAPAAKDSEPLATSVSESRRFPRTAWRSFLVARKRARQDSNLRPPA